MKMLTPKGFPSNRISGTTALQGTVDSSFTLAEDKRGSGKAVLSCIGRDIEFRELELKRNGKNVWEVISDSYERWEVLRDNIILIFAHIENIVVDLHENLQLYRVLLLAQPR